MSIKEAVMCYVVFTQLTFSSLSFHYIRFLFRSTCSSICVNNEVQENCRKIVHYKGRMLIFIADMLCVRYSDTCIHTLMLRAILGATCYNSHYTDKEATP